MLDATPAGFLRYLSVAHSSTCDGGRAGKRAAYNQRNTQWAGHRPAQHRGSAQSGHGCAGLQYCAAGNHSVATTKDGGQGTSEAFGYTASVTGTATNLNVYLDSTDGVRPGLYSDKSSKPGVRLGNGSVATNTAGWVTVPLSGGARIASGTRYWIAIAATNGSGTVGYHDAGNSASSLDYSANGLANPCSISQQWSSNPASVYVGGATSTPPPPVAPANTAVPAVTGKAQQGLALTASTGTWTGTAPINYKYQWQESGTTNIASATSSSYTASAGDVAHTLDVVVTATNAGGSTPARSLASNVVAAAQPPSAPSNTAVQIVSGTDTQGQLLATTNGSWTGSPTAYAYQWRDCDTSGINCTSVTGANSSSYLLASSDVGHTMRPVVTATNAGRIHTRDFGRDRWGAGWSSRTSSATSALWAARRKWVPMTPWILAGTAPALLLLLSRALGPQDWRHPTRWRIPEVGPSLLVWFGGNALTAAIRLSVILVEGHVGLNGVHHRFEPLGTDEGTVLLGGALAAALLGLIMVRDGMRTLGCSQDTPESGNSAAERP